VGHILFFINYSTITVKVRDRAGVRVLVLNWFGTMTANWLAYVVSIDYKNMMWCTFQVGL